MLTVSLQTVTFYKVLFLFMCCGISRIQSVCFEGGGKYVLKFYCPAGRPLSSFKIRVGIRVTSTENFGIFKGIPVLN